MEHKNIAHRFTCEREIDGGTVSVAFRIRKLIF
jgi:hypothetical protein